MTTVAVRILEYVDRLAVQQFLSDHKAQDAFTPEERRQCAELVGVERWASRLCAKEAVRDALCRATCSAPLALHEIELLRGTHPAGEEAQSACGLGHPPRLILHDRAAEIARGNRVGITISHEVRAAVAVAIVDEGAECITPGLEGRPL